MSAKTFAQGDKLNYYLDKDKWLAVDPEEHKEGRAGSSRLGMWTRAGRLLEASRRSQDGQNRLVNPIWMSLTWIVCFERPNKGVCGQGLLLKALQVFLLFLGKLNPSILSIFSVFQE